MLQRIIRTWQKKFEQKSVAAEREPKSPCVDLPSSAGDVLAAGDPELGETTWDRYVHLESIAVVRARRSLELLGCKMEEEEEQRKGRRRRRGAGRPDAVTAQVGQMAPRFVSPAGLPAVASQRGLTSLSTPQDFCLQ